jgi:TonB family protein
LSILGANVEDEMETKLHDLTPSVSPQAGKGSPQFPDRRGCARQNVPFAYIELGAEKGGTVLNVSESGLALQAIHVMVDGEVLPIRCQLPHTADWITTTGRIVWTSDTKKTAGVQFVDISNLTRERITEWMTLTDSVKYNHDVDAPNEEKEPSPDQAAVEHRREPIPQFPKSGYNEASTRRIERTDQPVSGTSVTTPRPERRYAAASPRLTSSTLPRYERTSFQFPTSDTTKNHATNFRNQALIWIFASLSFVAVSILMFQFGTRIDGYPFSKTESFSETRLGLRLERSGNNWRLTWNPDAPVIAKAIKGHILITDGTVRRFLELESSDLRGGGIMYTPLTDDIVMRLEVDKIDSAETVSESVRVVSATPDLPATSLPSSGNASAPESEVPGSVLTPRTGHSEDQLKIAIPPSSGVSPREVKGSQSAVRDVSPRIVEYTSQELGTPTPMQRGPVSPVPVPVEQEPASESPVVFAGLPSAPSLSRAVPHDTQLQSAQLIERKDPVYPAVARGAHVSGAVEVRFHIRPDGTVHDVGVVKGNRLLSDAAIEAVQQWRYKPAMLSGTPVESDGSAIVNFEYQ